MSENHIGRFPVAELSELPEDIRDRILAVQEKSGFVPNVFPALAHSPEEFRAFFAYHDALMDKEGGLAKGEHEMIKDAPCLLVPGNHRARTQTISNPQTAKMYFFMTVPISVPLGPCSIYTPYTSIYACIFFLTGFGHHAKKMHKDKKI